MFYYRSRDLLGNSVTTLFLPSGKDCNGRIFFITLQKHHSSSSHWKDHCSDSCRTDHHSTSCSSSRPISRHMAVAPLLFKTVGAGRPHYLCYSGTNKPKAPKYQYATERPPRRDAQNGPSPDELYKFPPKSTTRKSVEASRW